MNSDMHPKLGTTHPLGVYQLYLEASWLHGNPLTSTPSVYK